MPFTAEGVRPDIIVNPHALPSRMTIGMLVEMLLGIECVATGHEGDGTPYRDEDAGDLVVDRIGDALEAIGMRRDGTVELYNAVNGRKMESRVFMAPAYYQRLKHMVSDKVHARGRGPVQLLTRQPQEGRSRDGGLRVGEMERDCLVAHGISQTLRESLCDKSDPYQTTVCAKCGVLCQPGIRGSSSSMGYCRGCGTSEHCRLVRLPYCFKLLYQELQALHIVLRFRFRDDVAQPGHTTLQPVFEFAQ